MESLACGVIIRTNFHFEDISISIHWTLFTAWKNVKIGHQNKTLADIHCCLLLGPKHTALWRFVVCWGWPQPPPACSFCLCSYTQKFRFTPLRLLLSDISSIAPFDEIDCYTLQHSKWYGLCCCEGELCRPPCENGGRCLANEKGGWRCYCWPDFSGERCEVNHCTDYCLNGGTCMGSPLGKFTSNLSIQYCMKSWFMCCSCCWVLYIQPWVDQTCWENLTDIFRCLPISSCTLTKCMMTFNHICLSVNFNFSSNLPRYICQLSSIFPVKQASNINLLSCFHVFWNNHLYPTI